MRAAPSTARQWPTTQGSAALGLRLVGRLVPVRVYPFHFTGAGGAAAVYGAGKLSKTVTC
jgi:hypothetical protein